MCTHVLLIAPAAANPAAVITLANRLGFRASTELWPGEPRHAGEVQLLDPDGSRCDCGTPIGSALRKAADPERLEHESREGKRAKWTATRRARWIEQRLSASHRPAGPALGSVESSLQRWCDLARAAAKAVDVRRVGVLVVEPETELDDWQPSATTTATTEGLLRVAFATPTWLLPTLAVT